MNFYQIFENCSSLKLFCNKIIASPDNSIYLSSFLDQIPNQNLKNYLHARLVDQIEDILNRTEIGEKFSVVIINSNILYLDLTPKKFLNLLLVLHEEKITPKLLDELAQNINSFTDYDQMVAKALLVINNHSKKNYILNEFNINGILKEFIDVRSINNAKSNQRKRLDLPLQSLGNPDNLNKFLFFIAIAQILNVKMLSLSSNQLTNLPTEIGNLTSLRFLDLSFNEQLTSLPAEIENLSQRGCVIYRKR